MVLKEMGAFNAWIQTEAGGVDHSGCVCESHASRAATDGDVTGSGIPGGRHGALPCLGQRGGVERGPYLGYGGGSGV